ncbi:unnamed protein product [Rhizoctonia solani]|uniref:Uncharacterized protein n=1 Tax=Rhizoctonia solani TaxID=456999 RepID=A0A8H3GA47_9AGAM|nr:unnamed protein product [Rhizoctonia solani]
MYDLRRRSQTPFFATSSPSGAHETVRLRDLVCNAPQGLATTKRQLALGRGMKLGGTLCSVMLTDELQSAGPHSSASNALPSLYLIRFEIPAF